MVIVEYTYSCGVLMCYYLLLIGIQNIASYLHASKEQVLVPISKLNTHGLDEWMKVIKLSTIIYYWLLKCVGGPASAE